MFKKLIQSLHMHFPTFVHADGHAAEFKQTCQKTSLRGYVWTIWLDTHTSYRSSSMDPASLVKTSDDAYTLRDFRWWQLDGHTKLPNIIYILHSLPQSIGLQIFNPRYIFTINWGIWIDHVNAFFSWVKLKFPNCSWQYSARWQISYITDIGTIQSGLEICKLPL